MSHRSLLSSLVTLMILVALAFAMRSLVESLLVRPVLALWLQVRSLLLSYPELIWRGMLLPALLLVALFSLRVGRRRGDPAPAAAPLRTSRTQAWAAWLARLDQGEYFKWQTAHLLGELTLEVVGEKERLSPEAVRPALKSGELPIPPAIAAYLNRGLDPRVPRPIPLLSSLPFLHRSPSPYEVDLEKLVAYLEEQLDVKE